MPTSARLLVATALLALVAVPARAAFETRPSTEPTPEERTLAVQVAESSLAARGLLASGPALLIYVERLHDKAATEPQALVIHYRYEGDLTLLTTVGLTSGRVLHFESKPHHPLGFAPEEVERGRALALADRRVQRLLPAATRRQLVVEPMTLRITSPSDPLHGHRVMRLLFRVGSDYLSAPVVLVDLTAGTVVMDELDPERDR